MKVTPEQLINEARTWLSVPYANQGRTREIGVDCGGLMILVGKTLGLTTLEFLGYANSPDGKTFERLLSENCEVVEPYDRPRIGDILAVNYQSGIQHCMFVTKLDPLTVIHAKRPRGVTEGHKGRGVVEHRLLPSMADFKGWQSTFRLHGVTNE